MVTTKAFSATSRITGAADRRIDDLNESNESGNAFTSPDVTWLLHRKNTPARLIIWILVPTHKHCDEL